MGGYDYGNARLRAMKSRLLSRQELDALAEAGTLKGLITALTKTPYCKTVEAALARSSGMDGIATAFRDDLVTSLGKVHSFYKDDAREMVAIVLRTYDIHNLKAVLRGLSTNATPGEILAALLPVGELKSDVLAELARSLEPRTAIDLLASMNSPFAQPLLNLRGEHPGADTTQMELVLEQWGLREAKSFLESEYRSGGILYKALNIDADLANLLTVLRFAHSPAERKFVRAWLGEEDLQQLLLGPGSLPFDLLVRAGLQDTLDAAVEIFAGNPYEASLRAGLKAHAQSGRLSDLERQLRHFRLEWMAAQILADPLGIGMVLGYCALKVNEVSNLRWIVQGINLGSSAQAIRANLEFVS